MPGKAEKGAKPGTTNTDWDDPKFLIELALGLYQVSMSAGTLTPQAKDAVSAYLKARGFNTSWEAIR